MSKTSVRPAANKRKTIFSENLVKKKRKTGGPTPFAIDQRMLEEIHSVFESYAPQSGVSSDHAVSTRLTESTGKTTKGRENQKEKKASPRNATPDLSPIETPDLSPIENGVDPSKRWIDSIFGADSKVYVEDASDRDPHEAHPEEDAWNFSFSDSTRPGATFSNREEFDVRGLFGDSPIELGETVERDFVKLDSEEEENLVPFESIADDERDTELDHRFSKIFKSQFLSSQHLSDDDPTEVSPKIDDRPRKDSRRREGALAVSINSEPTPSTVVLEDAVSRSILDYNLNKKKRKVEKKKKRIAKTLRTEPKNASRSNKPTDTVVVESDDENENDSPTKEDVDDEYEYDRRYEDEGGFLGFVEMGAEEEKMKEAKSEIERKRKESVLRSLMHISQTVYCDDITKDPSTSSLTSEDVAYDRDETKRLDDQKHTDRLQEIQNDKLIYADALAEKLNEEGLLDVFKNTETVRMLGEYAKCRSALSNDAKYKDVGAVTKSKNLPLITAKYAQKYLREPIEKLGERHCLNGDECISVFVYKAAKRRSSLASTMGSSTSSGVASTGHPIDGQKNQTTRGSEWNSGTQKASDYIRADKRDEGFVLREFLLPDEERSIAEQVRLGTTYKDVYQKRKRKFCLLCNRYFTSLCTSRVMAAVEKCPKNAIHDHVCAFGVVGEYTEKSILNHGEGLCGVIDGFVSWDDNDYVPGSTTVEYTTLSGKEKVSLRCWFQRNIVREKDSHDRQQGGFGEINVIETVVAEYPKIFDLLKRWYPLNEFYLYVNEKSKTSDENPSSSSSSRTYETENLATFGSPSIHERCEFGESTGLPKGSDLFAIWRRSSEESNDVVRARFKKILAHVSDFIWHDDVSKTSKHVNEIAYSLYGRKDVFDLPEEKARWFFPYWYPSRADFPAFFSKHRRLRSALLVRINFAMAVREREYESLKRSWTGGPGAYGSGSFYDYPAYVGFNVSEQKKSAPHGHSNLYGHSKNDRHKMTPGAATTGDATMGGRDYFFNFEMEILKPKKTRLDLLKIATTATTTTTTNEGITENEKRPAKDVSSVSHRLFKLNIFLETNRRIYRSLKTDPSIPPPLPKVPKRRCRMDEKYMKVTRESMRTHEGLKRSLEIYEDLLFEKEIANGEWDGFYRKDVDVLYEFFKKPHKDSSTLATAESKERAINEKKAFVSKALFTTDNVELFHMVGVGYHPRSNVVSNIPSQEEVTPFYDTITMQPMEIYGTERSLLMVVLYVVCACERIATFVKKKFAPSLSHPSRVVEWFGTTASKTGAFPIFVDATETTFRGVTPETISHVNYVEPIVRRFDKDHPFSKQNGKMMQKTTQSVYERQTPGQMTKEFYELLEKYLFCLHAYRMSFLSAMLYYKRAKRSREENEKTTSILPTTDDQIPYATLFPFDGTEWSGEEGLRFLTHHKLPDISKIIKQVAFWSKGSGQDNISAIAYAFQKSLTYRSQCRDTAKKTVDTCKNHPTAYEYFRTILFLTVTGGYERYLPPTFSPSVESKMSTVFPKSGERRPDDGEDTDTTDTEEYDDDENDRGGGKSEKTAKNMSKLKNDAKHWVDGRFFNYTVRPSFSSCLLFVDEILTHPSGSKKLLNFVKYQKIFTQQVWRENLIKAVKNRSHLREVQPYLDWNSLENSTDFALNYYRTFVDDTLRLPRKTSESEEDGANENDVKKKTHGRNKKTPHRASGFRGGKGDASRVVNFSDPRPDAEELYTPKVSEILKKLENGEEVGGENFFARILNFEVSLERLKKMNKIFPFTKGSFSTEICDRMTLYQDKCIIYEQEKKMEISDLKKCLDLLKNETDVAKASSLVRSKEEEAKKEQKKRDMLEGSAVLAFLPKEPYEPNGDRGTATERFLTWDENLGCFTSNVVHESVLNESRKNQRVVKNLLLKIIAHSASFEESREIPRCLSPLIFLEKKYADMIEYLKDDDTDVNEEVVKHYLVYTVAELKNFKEEHTIPLGTQDFLWKFATRHLEKKREDRTTATTTVESSSFWSMSKKETEEALVKHLGEEGLEVFYKLEQLYPDKMKPKSINDILENTSVRIFSNLYFLFRSIVFANSVSLIPLEASVEKKIHEAMKYRRYEIMEDFENLPDSAYDVYLTKCCNKITTPTSYGSYGQYGLSYDHGLSAIVCNRKSKKRTFSTVMEDAGKKSTVPRDLEDPSDLSMEENDDDDDDDLEGGTFKSTTTTTTRGVSSGRGRGRGGRWPKVADGSVKKTIGDSENIFDFSRTRECDGKTKFKIAKRIKRLRETASCFNSEAMRFNIRGYMLVRRTRGKSPKVYGHCPRCAQFHAVSSNGGYGLGGYACERCRRVTPENYLVGECRKCEAQVFDEQIGRSVKLPIVDVNDCKRPIKRLVWCKHHAPKGPSFRFSTRPSATMNKKRMGRDEAEAVKWVPSYDTEIYPLTFLDMFERRPFRRRTRYGNIFGKDENEKKTMDQIDKEAALAGFKSSLASLKK